MFGNNIRQQTLDSLIFPRAIIHVKDRPKTMVKCGTQESYKYWTITVTICVNAIEDGSPRVAEVFEYMKLRLLGVKVTAVL